MGQPSQEYKKLDSSYHAKHNFTSSGGHSVKPQATDSVGSDGSRSPIVQSKVDDKLSALMSYRKARGLCFKCGAKWGPQHKCSAFAPLHLVEEVWQLLSDPTVEAVSASDSDDDELMALSEHALKGLVATHTLKFAASI